MNMKDFQRWARVIVAAVSVCVCSLGWSMPIRVETGLSHPILPAGAQSKAYLRVAMTGDAIEKAGDRAPVNIALVLDKSGSMQGEKIRHAKDAAIMLVQRLRADDIVSVVTYDTNISVVMPATKLSDKSAVIAGIQSIQADGSTALFAGVSKGAAELRKFLSKERVNRIILLSDGLANVGPSSPADLAELGASLGKEGMTVTTIGLGMGYNEDLMLELAQKSDGNHIFAENPTDLARAFDAELGDVLTVAAQAVTVRIQCADGVRPVRVLGREGIIDGQRVEVMLNQIYAQQMKYVMLEVEVPARGEAGTEQRVATVDVSYTGMNDGARHESRNEMAARLSSSPTEVDAAIDKTIMAQAVRQIGVENTLAAIQLRDAGKEEEARRAFMSNGSFLDSYAGRLQSRELERDSRSNGSLMIDQNNWDRNRKAFKETQNTVQLQQQSR